jgi:hypothetical protein
MSVMSGLCKHSGNKKCCLNHLNSVKIYECGLTVQERMELPWIRLAVDFAALDIFCPDLLQYVFEEEFLKRFLSRGNTYYGLLKHIIFVELHKVKIHLQSCLFTAAVGTMIQVVCLLFY